MKLALLVLLIFGATLVSYSDAACKIVCVTRTVRIYSQRCNCYIAVVRRRCYRVCSSAKTKRSISQTIEDFPCNFQQYDADKNGLISKNEFATALNLETSEKEFDGNFNMADKSGDGYLDCSEFEMAPFQFKCKPEC